MSDEPDATPFDLAPLLRSWERSLKARKLQPKTIQGYMLGGRAFQEFLLSYSPAEPDEMRPAPTTLEAIHREHAEAWVTHTADTISAATAGLRLRQVKVFFNWLVTEDEIDNSPFERVSTPATEEHPPPVLTTTQLEAMLNLKKGKSFEDRRDEAIIRLFLDTGLRIAELSNRTWDDVDLDLQVIHVMGKGRRARAAPFGRTTALALDRYQRIRRRVHPESMRGDAPPLWVWVRGGRPLSAHGIRDIITRTAEAAGLGHVHPHQFRHTFADLWLKAGGSEADLMRICGWRSVEMARRYGSHAAHGRALDAYRNGLSPGDRLGKPVAGAQ